MYIKLLMKEIRHCMFKIFKLLFIFVVNGMGACMHTLRIRITPELYYLGYWDSQHSFILSEESTLSVIISMFVLFTHVNI